MTPPSALLPSLSPLYFPPLTICLIYLPPICWIVQYFFSCVCLTSLLLKVCFILDHPCSNIFNIITIFSPVEFYSYVDSYCLWFIHGSLVNIWDWFHWMTTCISLSLGAGWIKRGGLNSSTAREYGRTSREGSFPGHVASLSSSPLIPKLARLQAKGVQPRECKPDLTVEGIEL